MGDVDAGVEVEMEVEMEIEVEVSREEAPSEREGAARWGRSGSGSGSGAVFRRVRSFGAPSREHARMHYSRDPTAPGPLRRWLGQGPARTDTAPVPF